MNIAAGENRILGGDREIGGEDEAETKPGCSPLHRGDDRLWHMPQPNQKRVQRIDRLIERSSSVGRRELDQLTEHPDVAARAEMGTGTAQQYSPGRAILGGFGGGNGECSDRLPVDSVEHVRPVQADLEHRTPSLNDNVRHGSAPSPRGRIMLCALRRR